MAIVGVAITFLGFIIGLLSLTMASAVGARMAIVLVGLAVCLTGIIGVLNPAYLKNAIWRK